MYFVTGTDFCWKVSCKECWAARSDPSLGRGSEDMRCKARAIEKWNRRPNPTQTGQQALSDEQVQRFMYRMIEAGFLPQRPHYDTDMTNARAILATAAPATADAPQRHSWTLEGMKRDPQGVWVLTSHVGTADAPEVKQ